MLYKVAIIGVGHGGPDVGAHSIGYAHACAYQQHGRCRIIAAADVSQSNLRRFARTFQVDLTYEDYREMLLEAKPDIISVSAYVGTRKEMVTAAIASGVRAIWCEKPFALSMDDGLSMVELCHAHDVKLIVNHWRRYLPVFRDAKQLLKEQKIGRPVEFFATLPEWDLMEMGTHWLDLFRFFSGDQQVNWVMGQVRCSGDQRLTGHLIEEHGIACVGFEDGTRGVLDCGWGTNLGQVDLRLIGTEGLIDLSHDGTLRVLNDEGLHASQVHLEGYNHGVGNRYPIVGPMARVLHELIGWMEDGTKPEVSGDNALLSAELYLAAYESALRTDRVDIPLRDQSRFPLDVIIERRAG